MEVDCYDLPERLREICLGTAIKSNGLAYSLSARKKIISSRLEVPIDSIELPTYDGTAKCEKELAEPVGTFLKKHIEKLFTIKTGKGCGCQNLATQMDIWGIAGCEKRRGEIVEHLIKNRDILVGSLAKSAFSFVKEAGIKESASMAMKLAGDWWHGKDVTREAEIAGANWLLDMAIAGVQNEKLSKKRPRVTPQCNGSYTCRSPIDTLEPFPFTDKPNLTLLCHCWPNGENWKNHVEYIKPVSDIFTRKIMGVAVDKAANKFDEVRRAFGDSWEYIEVENNSKLREVATYRPMLDMVKSTNENDVTFCIHTKGAQAHTAENEQIKWWTKTMYETVVYNWQNVLKEMENGYSVVGSFRRFGGHFKSRYGWHYSGTFYAFRNQRAFINGVPPIDEKWWGTESWPGNHFSKEESACIFADQCGDIYKASKHLEDSLIEWRKNNAT